MTDGSSGINKAVSASAGFLEKAIEFRFFLLIASMIIFLDSCLLVFYHENILDINVNEMSSSIRPGNIMIFVGVFTFIMAVFFPFVRKVVIVSIAQVFPNWTFNRSVKPTKNHWELRHLENVAIKHKSSFIISMVEKHKEENKQTQTTLNVGFGLSIISVSNYFIGYGMHHKSITEIFGMYENHIHGLVLSSFVLILNVVFIGVVTIIMIMALDPSESDYIYIRSGSEPEELSTNKENRSTSLMEESDLS